MGFALAEVAASLGAEVQLITGPTHEKINHPSVAVQAVVSANEMFLAVKTEYKRSDIAIAAAAVADFTPQSVAPQKLKKGKSNLSLSLIPTEDILAYMGENKKKHRLIGFALETENELENAKIKLKQKNLDGIVLNSLQDPGAGFSVSTNKITFIHSDHSIKTFPLQSKLECAHRIFEQILSL